MTTVRMFQSAFEALFPGLPGVPPGFHLAEFPDDELVLHAVTRRSHDLDDLVTPPEGV